MGGPPLPLPLPREPPARQQEIIILTYIDFFQEIWCRAQKTLEHWGIAGVSREASWQQRGGRGRGTWLAGGGEEKRRIWTRRRSTGGGAWPGRPEMRSQMCRGKDRETPARSRAGECGSGGEGVGENRIIEHEHITPR